jgi:hypothetical protein
MDLLAYIVLYLRERRWKCRQSEQSIDAEKDHRQDEQRFPLQIGIHDWDRRLEVRREWSRLLCSRESK